MENDNLQLKERVEELEKFVETLKNSTTIPFEVDGAFRKRLSTLVPDGLSNAPLSTVTAPSGGATIDSQARTTIGTIINKLQSLGLIS